MTHFYADLHIHIGRTSGGRPVKITAARDLTFENIARECAARKGIDIAGIVDCGSPPVIQDIKDLIAQGEMVELPGGGLRYRDTTTIILGCELETVEDDGPSRSRRDPTGSQRDCASHHIAYLPNLKQLEVFAGFAHRLVTNPELSSQRCRVPARELLRMAQTAGALFIPAHAFTPHKSPYGSCVRRLSEMFTEGTAGFSLPGEEAGSAGFSLPGEEAGSAGFSLPGEEAGSASFGLPGDEAGTAGFSLPEDGAGTAGFSLPGDGLCHLAALELGLSADSYLADRIAELAPLTFLSNSDAHSLPKIAREYNVLELEEPNFEELVLALRREKGRKVIANYGLDPRLGKYHRTFCLKCEQVAVAPPPVLSCPLCGGTDIVKGVLDRITEIADYAEPRPPDHRPPYHYQVPLQFLPGIGAVALGKLLNRFGTEMRVLHEADPKDLELVVGAKLTGLIVQAREGTLPLLAGGGGRYGKAVAHESETQISMGL